MGTEGTGASWWYLQLNRDAAPSRGCPKWGEGDRVRERVRERFESTWLLHCPIYNLQAYFAGPWKKSFVKEPWKRSRAEDGRQMDLSWENTTKLKEKETKYVRHNLRFKNRHEVRNRRGSPSQEMGRYNSETGQREQKSSV